MINLVKGGVLKWKIILVGKDCLSSLCSLLSIQRKRAKSHSFEEKEINLFAKKKINLYKRIMIKLRSLQFNKYSYNFKSMLPKGQERDYTLCFED